MSNIGWISLSRSIQDHWLSKEKRSYSKFEAWIDILLSANHMDNKFMLGNEVITLKRGSFITSELKLMSKWGWSKSKVRAFLSLLQKENMVKISPDSKKTTLTVVKYEDYQPSKTKEKPVKNQSKTDLRPLSDTNNNDNNLNNENKLTPISPELDFSKFDSPDAKQYWDMWIKYRKDEEIRGFKSIDTEQIAVNSLVKLADGSSRIAKLIIEQSISSRYQGLFKLKYTPVDSDDESFDWDKFRSFITDLFGREFNPVSDEDRRKIKDRMNEGWTKEDVQNAIISVKNDPFHIENNYRYVTPGYFGVEKTLQMHATKKIDKEVKFKAAWE